MPAYISSFPDNFGYNGNDIWTGATTDLVNTSAAAVFELEFSGSGPVLAETLTLQWGGESLELTVEASTNPVGTAIPTKNVGDTLAEYAEAVASAFRENGLLSAAFLITTSGASVLLTSRTPGVLDLTTTGTLTNTTITDTDGTDPNTEPNLACQLEIWKVADAFNDEEVITRLHATYDADTGTTEFNLGGLFPVQPALPNENSIAFAASLSWKRDIASGCWQEYYLRVADKFGNPAIAQALLRQEGQYVVFHGARPEDHDTVNFLGFVRPLHGYRRADGITFRKPVTDVQPDWVYLYTLAEITSCTVEWEVTWDNGDTTTEAAPGSSFTLLEKKVYWIRSTPYDATGFTPPAAGVLPWYYTFRLKGDAGSGVATIYECRYQIKQCTDWDHYLLLDNGLGGCESVLMRGKGVFGFDARRDTARKARTSAFNLRDGEITTYNPEAQKKLDLNTGWHDLYYIQHLRQLITGTVWLIDTAKKRFLRLVCETSSIETHADDGDLYALNVTFKTAWIDKAQNP